MVNYQGRLDHTCVALADPTRGRCWRRRRSARRRPVSRALPYARQYRAREQRRVSRIVRPERVLSAGAGKAAWKRKTLDKLEAHFARDTSLDLSPTVGRTTLQSAVDLDYVPTGWYARAVGLQSIEPLPSGGARSKLLDAAISIIREKGYAATSVEELCARAGVTKGAFFHLFPTKDSLAVAAAHYWSVLRYSLSD